MQEKIRVLKDKFSSITNRYRYETCLALAGGGTKAIYGMGIGYKLRTWGVKIKEISGISAGAAMAFGILSESEEECIEYIEELCRRNSSNFHFSNLLKGERPFPHENIYRRSIRYGLNIEKIKNSNIKVYILTIKALPKERKFFEVWNKAKLISQTYQAYLLDEADREKGIRPNRVLKMMDKWNMQEVIFSNSDLHNPAVVEQIILNSSSIPPVISFQADERVYYFDGGLTNNLLLEKFPKDSKKIAVFYDDLTIFDKDRKLLEKTYLIRPSKKLPIQMFDYTNPVGIRDIYEMGKADAESQKTKILEYCKKHITDEIKKRLTIE